MNYAEILTILIPMMTFLGWVYLRIDKKFEKIDEKFEKMEQKFEKIDEKFEKIDEKFDQLNTKIDSVENSLSKDIRSIDRRLSHLEGFIMGRGFPMPDLKVVEKDK